ncbi:hypothetical protein SB6419_00575 [Klebsiella spallanzanii]|nr:hypothetical protein [Klebsiella spallanzanii]VUS42848.1 hypothetical protein SB6419_00575 [Klebsiella spallanzanii]
MKLQITLLTSALILALPVLAQDVPLNQAAVRSRADTLIPAIPTRY